MKTHTNYINQALKLSLFAAIFIFLTACPGPCPTPTIVPHLVKNVTAKQFQNGINYTMYSRNLKYDNLYRVVFDSIYYQSNFLVKPNASVTKFTYQANQINYLSVAYGNLGLVVIAANNGIIPLNANGYSTQYNFDADNYIISDNPSGANVKTYTGTGTTKNLNSLNGGIVYTYSPEINTLKYENFGYKHLGAGSSNNCLSSVYSSPSDGYNYNSYTIDALNRVTGYKEIWTVNSQVASTKTYDVTYY